MRTRDRVEQAMRKRRSAGLNMETPYRSRSTDDVVRIHVGFLPDQIEAMDEAAAGAGLTRSAWLRELVDDTFRTGIRSGATVPGVNTPGGGQ